VLTAAQGLWTHAKAPRSSSRGAGCLAVRVTPSLGAAAVRRMYARVGDLLQFVERQEVVVPVEPALAAVHDAAILGQYSASIRM